MLGRRHGRCWDGGTAGAANGGTAGGTTFTLQSTTVGSVISTAAGLSSYFLETDTPATAQTPALWTSSGSCLAVWPIYYGDPVSVPPGLLASGFCSFDRGSGVMQSTYKGWPLYSYVSDAVPGEGLGARSYTAKSPFVVP